MKYFSWDGHLRREAPPCNLAVPSNMKTWTKSESKSQPIKKSLKSGKTLAEQELSDDSDGDEDISLANINQDEDEEIKALVHSGADLVEIDEKNNAAC